MTCLRRMNGLFLLLFALVASGCMTFSAKEYDPSENRYPPSRYMAPPVWVPAYPQDLDSYYIYGNGNRYPTYNRSADNPQYRTTPPSPHTAPSYNYPLYYE